MARWWEAAGQRTAELWLRFVAGRPVSVVTIDVLTWGIAQAQAQARGKRAVLLVWDNAPWHESQLVRTWVRQHRRHVKQGGQGVRLISALLPSKRPWLNPLEREWRYLKRDARGHLARTLRAFAAGILAGLRRLGGTRIDVVDQVPDWFLDGHRRPPTGRPPGRPKGAKDSYKRAPYRNHKKDAQLPEAA